MKCYHLNTIMLQGCHKLPMTNFEVQFKDPFMIGKDGEEFKELNGHFKILGLDGRNGEFANVKRGGMEFYPIPLPTLQCNAHT